MRHILVLFIFLCFHAIVMAQNIRFEAQVSSTTVTPNGRFELTFTLDEAKIDGSISLPSLSDFELESGPNQSQQMQMMNGVVTTNTAVSYILRPKRQGTFTIGAAKVSVNGKQYKTQPITIEVTNQLANNGVVTQGKPTRAKGDVFLFSSLSAKEVYVGMPILVDYKLYTTMALEQIKPITIPSYTGFYVNEIKNFDTNETIEMVGGKRYVSKVLFRNLLYPNQSGALTIEPFELQAMTLGIGFEMIQFDCEATTIKVKNLPPNAPSDFSGAVGNWTATASVEKHTFTTDDVIPIRVIVRGNGDLKRVQPQALTLPNGIKAFDPKIIAETSNEENGSLINTKEIEYLIQANTASDYSIMPTFSYFDTKKQAYETIKMSTITLHISDGAGFTIDDNAPTNKDANSMFLLGKWLKIGGILLGILLVMYVLWKRKTKAAQPRVREIFVREDVQNNNPRHSILDEQLNRQYMPINSTQVVHNQVFAKEIGTTKNIKTSALKAALNQANGSDFYKEMNRILETLATDRYQVPPESVNKEQLLLQFKNMNVGEVSAQQFIQLWDATQMARYAGIANPERMQTHFNVLENLVVDN